MRRLALYHSSTPPPMFHLSLSSHCLSRTFDKRKWGEADENSTISSCVTYYLDGKRSAVRDDEDLQEIASGLRTMAALHGPSPTAVPHSFHPTSSEWLIETVTNTFIGGQSRHEYHNTQANSHLRVIPQGVRIQSSPAPRQILPLVQHPKTQTRVPGRLLIYSLIRPERLSYVSLMSNLLSLDANLTFYLWSKNQDMRV